MGCARWRQAARCRRRSRTAQSVPGALLWKSACRTRLPFSTAAATLSSRTTSGEWCRRETTRCRCTFRPRERIVGKSGDNLAVRVKGEDGGQHKAPGRLEPVDLRQRAGHRTGDPGDARSQHSNLPLHLRRMAEGCHPGHGTQERGPADSTVCCGRRQGEIPVHRQGPGHRQAEKQPCHAAPQPTRCAAEGR